MPQKTFFYSKNDTLKLVALIEREGKGILAITDMLETDFLNGFFDVSLCISSREISEWVAMVNPNKIIVGESHKIEKMKLGLIIQAAENHGLDVDFYGMKTDESGFLTDSSEYLVIHCDTVLPAPL